MSTPFADLSHRAQVARLRGLADQALRAYPLPGPVRFTLQLHLANTTFRVTDGSGAQYVLRVAQPNYRTEAQLRSEAIWLAALRRETDLGVPEPVATASGDWLTVVAADGVPEARACLLFRWVEGRFRRHGPSAADLRRVGGFMARLHAHTRTFTPPNGFTRPSGDVLTWLGYWLEPGGVDPEGTFIPAEDRALLDAAARRIHAQVAALGTGPDRFGLIHTDLHHGNVLFHHGEVRAIDFDDSGFEPYVYDPAVTLWAVRRQPNYPALRDALLDGYAAVGSLPIGTDTLLDPLIAGRYLTVCRYILLRAADHPGLRQMAPGYVRATVEHVRGFMGETG